MPSDVAPAHLLGVLHSDPGGLQVAVAAAVATSMDGVPAVPALGRRTLLPDMMRIVRPETTSPFTRPGRSSTLRSGASTVPSTAPGEPGGPVRMTR
jgi:hypothetical protein